MKDAAAAWNCGERRCAKFEVRIENFGSKSESLRCPLVLVNFLEIVHLWL